MITMQAAINLQKLQKVVFKNVVRFRELVAQNLKKQEVELWVEFFIRIIFIARQFTPLNYYLSNNVQNLMHRFFKQSKIILAKTLAINLLKEKK